MSDADLPLLRAIAAGDESAFERLFRDYHPRVYRFVSRLISDPALVDEVTCDTLHAVWEGAARFEGQSPVSSWVFGIAYRRSMKSVQRNARHTRDREPASSLEALTDMAPVSNPETWVSSALESHRLFEAMEALSSEHRAVLELTAMGHSVAEIAAIVDCPENTVKTRTFHARRKLRAHLQED